jgi:hypothetical protein
MRLEVIVHGKNHINRSGRFRRRDHFTFVARRFHSDHSRARRNQMPFRGVHIASSVGKWIAGPR